MLLVGVGHKIKSMQEDPKAARKTRAQGTGGVYCASWGNSRGGGCARGMLKPEFKLTIRGDIPPKLVGDVDTFEDMR